MKMLMAAFFVLAFFYIASWGVMFYSLVFRWTFTSWPFFASLTITAFVVMFLSCVFGVICWRNFNKGLAHYRACIFTPFICPLPAHRETYTIDRTVYVEDTLSQAGFRPGVFSNSDKDSGRASLDSMRMLTAAGTRYMVAANAVHV
jgi:hypothetical protein